MKLSDPAGISPDPLTDVLHKGARDLLAQAVALAMTFRLMMSAQKKWRKPDGAFRLPEIIKGVEFKGGLKQGTCRLITPSPTFGHTSEKSRQNSIKPLKFGIFDKTRGFAESVLPYSWATS